MSEAPGVRSAEAEGKLALLREAMAEVGAAAIRLRGIDWFAWVTAGGSSAVLLAAETGVAEVLVTPDEACVMTDEIEAERLREEEVPPVFSFHVVPWAEVELREHFVLGAAGARPVLSDRPAGAELPLPSVPRNRRLVLTQPEQQRYRELGLEAAQAMSEVMRVARPDWTEYQLAGAGAQALWRRGIHPALVLAAGERRLSLYRHPTPSSDHLGSRAMMVFCARRHGLYANLTRFVTFTTPPPEQIALMTIEATGLAAVVPGNSLSAVYHAFAQAYQHAGHPEAIGEHHQGGITGYLAREIVATAATATELETGMAVAFNPSLKGIKIEDTFLIGPHGLENLTYDPDWPAMNVQGRMRPLWLEATW
jgi:Xaa-Pro aminopeptidase